MGFFAGVASAVALVAIALGLGLAHLNSNPDHRAKFFAAFLNAIVGSQSPEFMKLRCEVLAPAHGVVLEIGPGSGVNFACLNSTEVTEWIGLEPNSYMNDYLEESAAKSNIAFPRTLNTNVGESIPYSDASFDTVILTHVLCSVDDPDKVLDEVTRVLKPGGVLLMLDHIAAEQGSSLNMVQGLFAPITKIIGNGCDFRHLTPSYAALSDAFDVKYEEFEAPMPMPIIAPHVKAQAIKKSVASAGNVAATVEEVPSEPIESDSVQEVAADEPAPADEAAPAVDETAPAVDEAAPAVDEAAPAGDEAAPAADDEAAPAADDEAAPAADDEAAPAADDEAAPAADDEAAPADDAATSDGTLASSDDEDVPSEEKTAE